MVYSFLREMRTDMKHNGPLRSILGAVIGLGLLGSAAAFEPGKRAEHNPREILERVDKMMHGDSSSGILAMTVQTEHWTRTLEVQFSTKGDDRFLVRILSPKKEKGTATLRSGSDIWNYLPKTNRVIKVPSVSLASSWMGSHFTYDDMLKDRRLADDFQSAVTNEEATESGLLVEITGTPKPDAPVVWGSIRVVVNTDLDLPRWIRYYDENGGLVRTLEFSDIGPLGGRRLPRRQRMTPAEKPGEFTDVVYRDLVYNPDLDDAFFSLRALQR
jgi:outer membrane lipoprotein-sorting protein